MNYMLIYTIMTAVGLTLNILAAYRAPKCLLASCLTHPMGWICLAFLLHAKTKEVINRIT